MPRARRISARVVARKTVFATPWFSVIAKTVAGREADGPFYALEPDDYVSVLALTPEGKVLAVRQFRPVVERLTLELPSGHVDRGETPEQAATRELIEETGYRPETLEFMGAPISDTGRLGNRMWCYFAPTTRPLCPLEASEPGIEAVALSPRQLARRVVDGTFDNALTYAVLLMASAQGRFMLPAVRPRAGRAAAR